MFKAPVLNEQELPVIGRINGVFESPDPNALYLPGLQR